MEFIWIPFRGLLAKDLQAPLLLIVVFCAKRVVLLIVQYVGRVIIVTDRYAHLVLLENTPLLTFQRLSSLPVIAPLHSISHGRHGEKKYQDSGECQTKMVMVFVRSMYVKTILLQVHSSRFSS